MSSVLAKTVAYMIFSVLLILFLNIVSYRETKKIHKNESSTKYIVSIPAVLKYTYLTMFVFGLFLFCVFLFFMLTGNETVTMGHIWFATAFASIGLLV